MHGVKCIHLLDWCLFYKMASWRCRKRCHCHQQFQNMDNNILQKSANWIIQTLYVCIYGPDSTYIFKQALMNTKQTHTHTLSDTHAHKSPCTHDARVWLHTDSWESDAHFNFSAGTHRCDWNLKLVSELVIKWRSKGNWVHESYPISLNKSQTGQFWNWQRTKSVCMWCNVSDTFVWWNVSILWLY